MVDFYDRDVYDLVSKKRREEIENIILDEIKKNHDINLKNLNITNAEEVRFVESLRRSAYFCGIFSTASSNSALVAYHKKDGKIETFFEPITNIEINRKEELDYHNQREKALSHESEIKGLKYKTKEFDKDEHKLKYLDYMDTLLQDIKYQLENGYKFPAHPEHISKSKNILSRSKELTTFMKKYISAITDGKSSSVTGIDSYRCTNIKDVLSAFALHDGATAIKIANELGVFTCFENKKDYFADKNYQQAFEILKVAIKTNPESIFQLMSHQGKLSNGAMGEVTVKAVVNTPKRMAEIIKICTNHLRESACQIKKCENPKEVETLKTEMNAYVKRLKNAVKEFTQQHGYDMVERSKMDVAIDEAATF